MTLRAGEIVLILDAGHDDFVAAPITSQQRSSPYELVISAWRAAGLNVASFVRIHKLTVLSKAEVVRRLGLLPEADSHSLHTVLCRAFCPRGSDAAR
jgi:mRNA-degrading endonuclease toxin of MazEF toxin-antitoxin module